MCNETTPFNRFSLPNQLDLEVVYHFLSVFISKDEEYNQIAAIGWKQWGNSIKWRG
jgi:hypothetical protein